MYKYKRIEIRQRWTLASYTLQWFNFKHFSRCLPFSKALTVNTYMYNHANVLHVSEERHYVELWTTYHLRWLRGQCMIHLLMSGVWEYSYMSSSQVFYININVFEIESRFVEKGRKKYWVRRRDVTCYYGHCMQNLINYKISLWCVSVVRFCELWVNSTSLLQVWREIRPTRIKHMYITTCICEITHTCMKCLSMCV